MAITQRKDGRWIVYYVNSSAPRKIKPISDIVGSAPETLRKHYLSDCVENGKTTHYHNHQTAYQRGG